MNVRDKDFLAAKRELDAITARAQAVIMTFTPLQLDDAGMLKRMVTFLQCVQLVGDLPAELCREIIQFLLCLGMEKHRDHFFFFVLPF